MMQVGGVIVFGGEIGEGFTAPTNRDTRWHIPSGPRRTAHSRYPTLLHSRFRPCGAKLDQSLATGLRQRLHPVAAAAWGFVQDCRGLWPPRIDWVRGFCSIDTPASSRPWVDDGIARIPCDEQNLEIRLPMAQFVGKLTAIDSGHDDIGQKQVDLERSGSRTRRGQPPP